METALHINRDLVGKPFTTCLALTLLQIFKSSYNLLVFEK